MTTSRADDGGEHGAAQRQQARRPSLVLARAAQIRNNPAGFPQADFDPLRQPPAAPGGINERKADVC